MHIARENTNQAWKAFAKVDLQLPDACFLDLDVPDNI
jgi:hypothetical protein